MVLCYSPLLYRFKLDLCTDFVQLNNITFNPGKFHCTKFSTNNTAVMQYPIYLQGVDLTWCNQVTHLRHLLTNTLTTNRILKIKQPHFVLKLITFLPSLHVTPIVQMMLFFSYCMSLYGLVLGWDLQHKLINLLFTKWHKAIHRLWRVPRQTHNALLPVLTNLRAIEQIIYSHFLNFCIFSLQLKNIVHCTYCCQILCSHIREKPFALHSQ